MGKVLCDKCQDRWVLVDGSDVCRECIEKVPEDTLEGAAFHAYIAARHGGMELCGTCDAIAEMLRPFVLPPRKP